MVERNWRIGHLDHLQTPWGNAGGTAKTPEQVSLLLRTRNGIVEHGSTSLEPRPDYAKKGQTVYHHDHVTGRTFNSHRLSNNGLDTLIEKMPDMNAEAKSYGKKIIYNMVPISADPAESDELVQRTYDAGAEAVLLDLSCPTISSTVEQNDVAFSESIWRIGRILSELGKIGVGSKYPRIFVRTPPQPNFDRAKTYYRHIESSKVVSALFVNNSWPYVPVNGDTSHGLKIPEGAGIGLSGPAMANQAAWQTKVAVEIANGSGIDVVSCCGINNASELKRRLCPSIGAKACSGTTFYRESDDWEGDTEKLLQEAGF